MNRQGISGTPNEILVIPTGNGLIRIALDPNATTGGGSGNVSINGSTGNIVFSNSNNVTFGFNASTVTASATFAGGGGAAISAGANSQSTGTVAFSNSNGVTFGLSNNGMLTATVATNYQSQGAYLTTAMQSNAVTLSNINVSAGTTSQNLSAFTLSNSNGVSFGLDGAGVITASAGAGAAGSISAGTTSVALGQVVFSNSNNVTFGLNGSTVTASASVTAGAAAINFSAGTTSNDLTAVVFSNSNQVSFGLNAGTITASVFPPLDEIDNPNNDAMFFMGTNQIQFQWGSNMTTFVTAASRQGLYEVDIVGGTNMTSASGIHVFHIHQSSNDLPFHLIHIEQDGTRGIPLHIECAGSIAAMFEKPLNVTSNATVPLIIGTSQSNVVSNLNAFYLEGARSSQFLTSQSNQAASASNGSFAFQTVAFSNANNVTFGTSAGSIITASVVAPGAAAATLSSYENFPLAVEFATQMAGNSGSSVVAFIMPLDISCSYIRLPMQMSNNSTSRAATASSMNASVGVFSTWNAVVYKLNTGASSMSLTWVASGQALWTVSNSISVATNGSQGSYSQSFIGAAEGGVTSFSTRYSVTNTNSYQFSSQTIFTAFSANRWLDIPFANSLAAGAYWLMVGLSTSSTANSTGISAASNCNNGFSRHFALSQANNVPIKVMGSTNSISINFGAGSFTTVGGGTTAELALSMISTVASHPRLYFQMIRRA